MQRRPLSFSKAAKQWQGTGNFLFSSLLSAFHKPMEGYLSFLAVLLLVFWFC